MLERSEDIKSVKKENGVDSKVVREQSSSRGVLNKVERDKLDFRLFDVNLMGLDDGVCTATDPKIYSV